MGVVLTFWPTFISECTRPRTSSSSSNTLRKSAFVTCIYGSILAPMRPTEFLCTMYPFPRASSNRTVFITAQTRRCPRRPWTQLPSHKRKRCCAHTRAGTRRKLVLSSSRTSSNRPPMPIGNSSGNARSMRPGSRMPVGSWSILCQLNTVFAARGATPAKCSAASRTSSSGSPPPALPSRAQLLRRLADCSWTILSSTRMYSTSSSKLPKSTGSAKRPPTTS